MAELYRVAATRLNLRSKPEVGFDTRLATLPDRHQVEKLEESSVPGWWRVKTVLNGVTFEGYVAARYLEIDNRPMRPATRPTAAPAVYMREDRSDITRVRNGGRAYPLGEAGRPPAPNGTVAERKAAIARIIEWLDVERHGRYLPKSGTTYCNIYAYDFCYLAGHYLPRVWWTPGALAEIERGHEVEVAYGSTVRELNANSLHDWLIDHGARFGWRRTLSLDECQDRANQGHIGIICAQRTDLARSGHITAIVPETEVHRCARDNGEVVRPLQSQAGRHNKCYFEGPTAWWRGSQFGSFGFWTRE